MYVHFDLSTCNKNVGVVQSCRLLMKMAEKLEDLPTSGTGNDFK